MDDDDVVWMPGPLADADATQPYRSAPAAGGARAPLMAVADNVPVDVEVAILKTAMQSAPPPRYFGALAPAKNQPVHLTEADNLAHAPLILPGDGFAFLNNPQAPSLAEPAAKKPRTLPPSLSGRAGWAPSYKVMPQQGASASAKPFHGWGAGTGAGAAPWQDSAASALRMPVTRTLPPVRG